jgi:response regulator RpfG family c-di-GMP phosphodiesterase
VAARLGLSVAERGLVKRTAELHDIGKLALSDAVLTKTGPLDQDEWEEVRRHTLAGDVLGRGHTFVRCSVREKVAADHVADGVDALGRRAHPLVARIVAPATLSTRWCRPGPIGPPERAAKPAPSWQPLPGRSSTPTSSPP